MPSWPLFHTDSLRTHSRGDASRATWLFLFTAPTSQVCKSQLQAARLTSSNCFHNEQKPSFSYLFHKGKIQLWPQMLINYPEPIKLMTSSVGFCKDVHLTASLTNVAFQQVLVHCIGADLNGWMSWLVFSGRLPNQPDLWRFLTFQSERHPVFIPLVFHTFFKIITHYISHKKLKMKLMQYRTGHGAQ